MEPVNKRNYSTQQRRDLAAQGKALPDGSFPIVDRADLANALQAIGLSNNRDLAEEHIIRRAKALDAMDMLPDWAMNKTQRVSLSKADKIVLKQMHNNALQVMSLPEWIGVIAEVSKAGGIRNVTGYAEVALTKAKSFNGNRSAAGAYAARVRWSGAGKTGDGSTAGKISDGSVSTSNPAGAGEAVSMEKVEQQHSEAIGAVGANTPDGQKLIEAQAQLKESRKADVSGDSFTAWEKASQAEFTVSQLADKRGALGPVKRLSATLKRLVLDLTDAFYAEEEAAA